MSADQGDAPLEGAAPKSKKLKFAATALAVLLLGGGVGFAGATYGPELLGLEGDAEPSEAGDEHAPEAAHGEEAPAEEAHGGGGHGEAPSGHGAPAAAAPKKSGPILIPLDPFTINLKGSGGARVLRLRVELQADAKHEEKLTEQMARMRDAVLTLGGDYTWSDLEGADGKMRLRDELLARVNSFGGKTVVDELFFTEFVVQ